MTYEYEPGQDSAATGPDQPLETSYLPGAGPGSLDLYIEGDVEYVVDPSDQLTPGNFLGPVRVDETSEQQAARMLLWQGHLVAEQRVAAFRGASALPAGPERDRRLSVLLGYDVTAEQARTARANADLRVSLGLGGEGPVTIEDPLGLRYLRDNRPQL